MPRIGTRYRNYPSTPVSIYWSQKYGAYALKFSNTQHFNEMTPIINFLKSKPYGESTYDPTDKVWYFAEEHLGSVRYLFKAFGTSIFTLSLQEKPTNTGHSYLQGQKVISTDQHFSRFAELTGENIKSLDYLDAKKIYRRFCMRLHPDKGGDPATMSAVNEIWSDLERVWYKTTKEPEYEIQTSSGY